MDAKKGFVSLLAAGAIFGSFGIWTRILSKELSAYQQLTIRHMASLVIALIIVFILKQKINFTKINKRHLLAYAFFYPITSVFFVLAILYTKISVATFAFYFCIN